ncbi:ATP-binding protein [Silvibacterium acidisoli]|uniref:ATP-binding protein n=1 Tax=Acidobacteriaceae bacterium ZG23-2 TaxID=2883246 RepID=UPI00406C09BB
MLNKLQKLSIRARLTLWHLAVIFLGAVLFGVVSYGILRHGLLVEKQSHLLGRETRLLHMLEADHAQGVGDPLKKQLANYALVTHEGNLFELRRADNSLLFPQAPQLASWAAPYKHPCTERSFFLRSIDGGVALVMCHQVEIAGEPMTLYVGSSLEEEFDVLAAYQRALLLLMPVIFVLALICGYFLSRRAMEPVDRMTRAAVGIGIGNLSARLPVPPAKDEVQQLAIAWNQLLARLEAAVKRLSQFSADASHDLRTSITVMLATAQLSLNRKRTDDEYREDLERIATECRTATTLLDALLSMARSDNFVHEMSLERVDLCELVVSGCRRVEDVADANHIMLDWSLPVESVHIEGDKLLLQRLLGILLDNAIKFTPEFGEVSVALDAEKNHALLRVKDNGIGMSQDTRRQIFDRFYQADLRERTMKAGMGLGLSIARWIADAHRAELTVESTPLQGSVFTIRVPLVRSDDSERALQSHS